MGNERVRFSRHRDVEYLCLIGVAKDVVGGGFEAPKWAADLVVRTPVVFRGGIDMPVVWALNRVVRVMATDPTLRDACLAAWRLGEGVLSLGRMARREDREGTTPSGLPLFPVAEDGSASDELVQAFKHYIGLCHPYWEVVIETWTDEDIKRACGNRGVRTIAGVVRKVNAARRLHEEG